MEPLVPILLQAMAVGWGVTFEGCTVGPPKSERITKPYATLTWSDEVIERGPGGLLDVRVDGIECTYYGPPTGSKKGELAKKEMSNDFHALIDDEQWQTFGLQEVSTRYLDDLDITKTSDIVFTIAMSASFTICP